MSLPNQSPKGPVGGVSIAAILIATSVLLGPLARAHEGHDHGDAAGAAIASTVFPRVVADSEQYELVGILKNGRLSITLDHLTTNAPVIGATVKVTVGDGQPITAETAGEGIYTLAFPPPERTGSIDLVFSVTADGNDDLLIGHISPGEKAEEKSSSLPSPVIGGSVSVAAWIARQFGWMSNGAATPRAVQTTMSDAPRRLPDGTLFVAKSTQRLLDVRTVRATQDTETPAIKLIARVIGDPNRTSVVQSLHGGRVIALEKGLPRIGQTVRKGDALVQIDPYFPLADRTTISEKTGEIEQLMAVAEMRIRRLRPLAERGAVPQSQVSDLETELEGLRLRREAMRNSRAELEILRAQSDGVISAAKVMPGQVVQAQDLLFQIIDPRGLWVEALAYGELDASSLGEATAVGTNSQTMSLTFEGFSPALQQHASVIRFAIPQPPANLSVGQPLTVLARVGKPVTGIIVQRDAVVRGTNGESIVWVHTAAERFEAKPVRVQPFDATRLIVLNGLAVNDRIVVRAAELINQIR
jgi:multidrug efflux pump subunit AcrA (membrane-fusion protein)